MSGYYANNPKPSIVNGNVTINGQTYQPSLVNGSINVNGQTYQPSRVNGSYYLR